MVASAHPRAAIVGAAILERGGNAFDAAIAVAAAEGVLLPMMCGLGGDGFAVVYDARRREVLGLNGSGVAAAGATREHYASRGPPADAARGRPLGRRPGRRRRLRDDLEALGHPARGRSSGRRRSSSREDGVAITAWVSRWIGERAEVLRRFPDSARQFLPGGRPPAPGERWAAPDLGAEPSRRGRRRRRDLLPGGARRAAPRLPPAGGRALRAGRLRASARRDLRLPADRHGLPGLHGATRPRRSRRDSSLLSQLNILEGFDLGGLAAGRHRPHPPPVEAKKLAFEDRNRHAGDPAFVQWPLAELIGKEHAARRRAEIDPARRAPARGRARPRARRRHELLRRRRRGRQRGLVHPQPVGGVRLGRRGRRHRHHAQQPGRPRVLAGRGPPERHRSGQADDAHAERLPRLPGRAAVAGRRDARRRPADPVEHAGDHQHDRPRALAAGGRGGAALVQLPRAPTP